MYPFRISPAVMVLIAALTANRAAGGAELPKGAKIDFHRDVRPIFSENCFACHGPDHAKRKADLRLDLRDEAIKAKVFLPGKSSQSEIYKRITTSDEDDLMPPVDSKKKLTPRQIEILKRWIDQGAEYKGHWSYLAPQRPKVPRVFRVFRKSWVRNEIDRFILARLEKEGLKPSSEADKVHLIRRVTLDLTGLPPTPGEIDAFLKDRSRSAYEKVVDRLLASPHFGERMAQLWLDVARFADTNGYHIDTHRDIWLWRDWVINAFNRNMPFDQFTIEQLAGDLLLNPTVEQKIATGFNRNEMVNFEGGADPNEYAVKYVVGRIDATSRTWLGTTMACAECHDHKYDPISQKEYYQFFAFFNTISEKGLDGQYDPPEPRMKVPSGEQTARLARFDETIRSMETQLKDLLEKPEPKTDNAQIAWENELQSTVLSNWTVLATQTISSSNGAAFRTLEDQSVLVTSEATNEVYEIMAHAASGDITGIRLETIPDESLPEKGAGLGEKGRFLITGLELEAIQPDATTNAASAPDFGKWYSIGPFKAESQKEAFQKEFPPEKEIDLTKKYEDGKLEWTARPEWKDGEVHELKGDVSSTYLYRTITTTQPRQIFLSLGSDDGIQVWLNGKKLLAKDVARGVAADQDKLRLRLREGENKLLIKVNNGGGGYAYYFKPLYDVKQYAVEFASAIADASKKDSPASALIDDKKSSGWSIGEEKDPRPHQAFLVAEQPFGFEGGTDVKIRLIFQGEKPMGLGRFRLGFTDSPALTNFAVLPEPVRAGFFVQTAERTNTQKKALQKHYRENFVTEVKEENRKLASEREARTKHEKSIPVTMVMQEMEKPRDTFLLVRGDFQNKGDKVKPGVPQNLGLPPSGDISNRLALARWLVDPNHPLTSRVTVNRFWQHYFGNGIVKTADDFGSQGEWPSHPELLDWLATRFIDSGWDIKALQKLMVMSAAYRQSSVMDPKKLEKDPENRLLARGPRFRLDAETIRDQVLALSGLLDDRLGGPSVTPYQPPGLWEAIGFTDNGNFSAQKYVQSKGSDNYRRGLYTYWKRSMPYASFVTFDAPSRETCTVKRPRTNTPLQALVLMNDPVYVEAARAFGERLLKENEGSVADRLKYAFKLCLGRLPEKKELALLEKAFQTQLDNFRSDPAAAEKFVKVGDSKPAASIDISELAAWTAIGNLLLNLDELITKG